jgi:perosamine synthetase
MQPLALDGGTPVRSMKPLLVEADVFEDEELQALVRVAKMKKLRRAEATLDYEQALAEWFGVKHAIAVSSGTTALHIALAAFGIGSGDEVIVTPYTFIASDTCVLEQNAVPVFADVDPQYLTLDPADVERKITKYKKAIIPVSIMGTPVDLDPIMDLARKHNLAVLEDCAQSPGATYKSRKVGTLGHVGAFSTIAGKITSTGEGGFVITDDDALYEKMWGYMDFGRKRSLGAASKYHWGLPCTNDRITNMQAAIGLEQVKKMDRLIAKRNENANYLTRRLKHVAGLQTPPDPPWGDRVYYYYAIRLQPEVLGADMLNFAVALAAEGIYDLNYLSTSRWIIPQHLQPIFLNKSGYGGTKCPFECPWYEGHVEYGPGLCPQAERACEEVFWLSSVHPLLAQEDLDDMATAVEKVATAFVAKKAAGTPVAYATEAHRAKLSGL